MKDRRYITADPFYMSIHEHFQYQMLFGNFVHEKAFKACVESYKKQFGYEPAEFIKWYNEEYLRRFRK